MPGNPALGEKEQMQFRSVLGSEAYAVLLTRRDLAAAVAILAGSSI